jgi:alcohol dehydrogenase
LKIRGAVLESRGASRPFADSRPIRVSTLELDPPRGDELLVRIEAAGLCHSDLSVVDGNRPRPTPMLLGHEAAGIVAALGPKVTDLTIGQRVVMTFLPRCGSCRGCATGGLAPCEPGSESNGAGTLLGGAVRLHRDGAPIHHHLGVSGFASHAVVSRASVVPVDDDVPPDVAAVLGCAVLTGGGAVINHGGLEPGDSLAVVGLGGVGMAALITGLAHEDVTVYAVDTLSEKRERALELGAHEALHPEEAVARGVKARVVIEAVGHVAALECALAVAAPGGRTITVGLPAPDARLSISPLQLVAEGRTLIGSYLGSALPSRDIPVFVDMWRRGVLPIEALISSSINLEDINAGMDLLADGHAVRQIINFDESEPE